MSCNTCLKQAAPVLNVPPALSEVAFAVSSPPARCHKCGAWMGQDETCHNPRCPGDASLLALALSPTVAKKAAVLDQVIPSLEQEEGQNALNNEFLAAMYSDIATVIAGAPRQVVLRPNEGVFGTDLRGTIVADPYPLGESANRAHNLLLTRTGLLHELAHEEWTPQHLLENVLAITRSAAPMTFQFPDGSVTTLHPAALRLVKDICNVVEDGRIERRLLQKYPGGGQLLAASAMIMERWDKQVGDEAPQLGQLLGAMLYTALPCFSVSEETISRMSEPAQSIYRKAKPIIEQAVWGEADDVYWATLAIARLINDAAALPFESHAQKPSMSMPEPPAGVAGGKAVPGQIQPGESSDRPGGESSQDALADGQVGNPEQAGSETGQGMHAGSQTEHPAQGGQTGRELGQGEEAGNQAGGEPGQDGRAGGQSGNQGQTGNPDRHSQAGGEPAQGEQVGNWGQAGGEPGQNAGAGGQRENRGGIGNPGQRSRAGGEPGQNAGAGNNQMPRATAATNSSEPRQQGFPSGQAQPHQGQKRCPACGQWLSDVEPHNCPAVQPQLTQTQLDNILDSVVTQALRSIGDGLKRKYSAQAIGKRLRSQQAGQATYQNHEGRLDTVALETIPASSSELDSIVTQARAGARPISAALRKWRGEAEAIVRNQQQGQVDRGRFVRAVAGAGDVYQRREKVGLDTNISASILLDTSTSMIGYLDDLAAAGMTTAEALNAVEGVTFEIRAFNHESYVAKAMDAPFTPAVLNGIRGLSGGTRGGSTVAMARNVLSTSEGSNKIMFVMTDGRFNDHEAVKRELQAARESGIGVIGVYFDPADELEDAEGELNELYGQGNWIHIQALEEYPAVVQKHLQAIYRRIARQAQQQLR